MKIVLPVHHFPPRYSAGAELYTYRLARWLQAHGHSVEVVAIETVDKGAPDALQASLDHYGDVPVWRLAFNLGHAADPLRWSYDNPLLRAWFDSYVRRTTPDLLHLQAGYLMGIAPLAAAAAAQIPTILTLHDYWFLCPRITLQRRDGALCNGMPADPMDCAWCVSQDQRRYRYLDRLSVGTARAIVPHIALRQTRATIVDRRALLLPALTLPDAVVAPSHFLAAQFRAYVPPERLHISRYGLDLAPFERAQQRPADGTLRIGYLGQIAPHKGVHLLVEAFRRAQTYGRAAELQIYGGLEQDPAYTARLRQLAGDDPRIRLEGRFEHSRVVEILEGLDVTVVPSQWYENSPLAIMEAQAAGVPVITTRLGGMAELVRHDVDGLWFQPGDARDLAAQIERALAEPTLLPRLAAGITRPRSVADEMEQLMALYEHVTTAAPAALQA